MELKRLKLSREDAYIRMSKDGVAMTFTFDKDEKYMTFSNASAEWKIEIKYIGWNDCRPCGDRQVIPAYVLDWIVYEYEAVTDL